MKTHTINTTIFADDDVELSVEVNYSYRPLMLSDTRIHEVYAIVYGDKGETPDFVFTEQIHDIIRAEHTSIVRFEDTINITFS